MNLFRILISLMIMSGLFVVNGISQELKVVYLQGDVKSYARNESSKKAKSVIYGPISTDQVLIMGANSSLTLLAKNGEISELDKKGIWEVSALNFYSKPETSIFGRFKDYFQSFFGVQNVAENLNAHLSTILAGSRGQGDIPVAISPRPGKVSLDFKDIEFRWLTDCDTCHYKFTIFSALTNTEVYSVKTKSQSIMLSKASVYLKPGQKYYWVVETSGVNQEYSKNMFIISSSGEFNKAIKSMESELAGNKIASGSITAHLLILANLIESNQLNFATQYVRKVKSEHPKNTDMIQRLESMCWNELKKEVLANH